MATKSEETLLELDGREVRIYYDGNLDRSFPFKGALKDNGEPLLIGRRSYERSSFCGVLDDLRIYSAALSPGEVRLLAATK